MLKFLGVVLEQERGFRSVVEGIGKKGGEEGGEEERTARAVRAAVERGVLSGCGCGGGKEWDAVRVEYAQLPPFEESRVRIAVPEGGAGLSTEQRNGWKWLYAYALLDQLWESHLARCPEVKNHSQHLITRNTEYFFRHAVQREGRPPGTVWAVHEGCAGARPRDLRARRRVAQGRPGSPARGGAWDVRYRAQGRERGRPAVLRVRDGAHHRPHRRGRRG